MKQQLGIKHQLLKI